MSKQTLVTMPCVMLLLGFLAAPSAQSGACCSEKIPFFLISAVVLRSSPIWPRQMARRFARSKRFRLPCGWLTRAVAYASYLQKAIVPWNLGVYYPYSTDI